MSEALEVGSHGAMEAAMPRLSHLRRHDRIVVGGGGPVGAVTALLLAQAGLPVTLLEHERGVVLDYRASTFHPPTLDLLEESGITDALVAMGLIAPTMQIRDRRQGRIAEFDLSALKHDTHHPYRLQCEQFKLVEWAYGRLRAMGADLRLGHRIASLARAADEVLIEVESDAGRETLAADILIACDGGRSIVRKALGIDFEGFTYPEHFGVAGTRFDFHSCLADICSVNYTADPVEWFLLLQIPDMWRIVLPADASRRPEDALSERSLQASLQNILPRTEDYEITVRAIYRVHQRIAKTYRSGRVFLAGDAAHLNNPLGGMGLNGGLHDAISLTDRLIAVWHGHADEAVLDGYEPQRRSEAINAIQAITARNKRLMEERDPDIRERNLDELRRTAADPALSYQYLLDASMISSLRRSGMLQ